jgi:hypothetical protein
MRYTFSFQSLLSAVFFVSSFGFVIQADKAPSDVRTVSMCELAKNWKLYDHKIVRGEGIYTDRAETRELYDKACPNNETAAWVEPSDAIGKSEEPHLIDELKQLIRTDGRARVVVVGEFAGPKTVDIPPNTPANIADAMTSIDSRYGHQNHWNFEFTFVKIERVDSVPKTDPWPHWSPERK